MRNIFIVLTILLLFTACGEETTVQPPVTESAYITTTSNIGILKQTDNSKGIYSVGGISQLAGDTVTITFDNATHEADYTITKGFVYDDEYRISLQYNGQDFAATQLNVTVTNKNGVEIMNSPVYLFTVSKIHPINVNTSLPISQIFDFTTEKTKTIILEKYSNEYSYSYGDGSFTGSTSSSTASISSYGFTNTGNEAGELDNSTASNNYVIDTETAEFTVNNTQYPNCFISNSTGSDSKCALNVTYNGQGLEKTSFYIRTKNKSYIDTKLDFFAY